MKVEESGTKQDPTDKIYKFSDEVKFKVAYPKKGHTDYPEGYPKYKQHLKEGATVTMHAIQAEDLEKRGLGKIVKD